MQVGWTYIEEGFFCHRRASLNWNPQRQCKEEDGERAAGE